MEALHYTIRRVRLGKNFTQEYVAAQLDITTRSYRKLENGEISPTYNRLLGLAKALEVDVSELLVATKEKSHPKEAGLDIATKDDVHLAGLVIALKKQNEILDKLSVILMEITTTQPPSIGVSGGGDY